MIRTFTPLSCALAAAVALSALTAAAPASALQAGLTPQNCEAGGNIGLWRISQGYRFKGVGQPMTDWQKPGNSLNAFAYCKPMVVALRGDLLAQEHPVGQIDGYTTFSTSHPAVGVQYRIHDRFGAAQDIKGNGESFLIAIESSQYKYYSHQETYPNVIQMSVEYRYIALADHLPAVVALEDQPLFVYSTDGGPAGEGVLTAKVEYLAAE
ncbi:MULTISPECIES: hypothetical protein [Stenotrophomonas]|uniref:hypothetical protein n=1 Tax=Stenotrophomonas sp. CC22-02 TaxID=1378087 RepID=UPI001062AB9D|nr:hypothetical protein [Stenotrophomonas sp. CC22-02]TDV30720.1 hypothetical protein N440_1556 [Stenotrophomonas sp. CC22-02]